MTYCLAMKLDAGLVFAADTRTNAGVDYVTAYKKLHVFDDQEDRLFVMLSAGNLAVTTEIIDTLRRDLASGNTASLATCQYPFDAAQYVGKVSRRIQDRHRAALVSSGISGEVSLILGGQVRGTEPDIFLIYPQGNYISASPETPFLQIGESKYGKPMLDRILHPATRLEDAARLALVSLDATMRSNVTVGPPFDLAIYKEGPLRLSRHERIEVNSNFYLNFRATWQNGIELAFEQLPRFDWES